MTYPLLEYPEDLRDFDHVERLLEALPQLMNNRNGDRYTSAVQQGVHAVRRALAVDRPFTGIDPGELATVVDDIDLDEPLEGTAEALRELETVYLKEAVHFHHPRYAAHLNCPVVIPALLGETVLTAINSSLDTWDQSAGATLIERRLIDWTANRLGLGTQADGVFTSGGSQSNLQALLIARNHARRGGAPLDCLRIFASDAAHFSVQKSAALLGLEEGAVVVIPTDGKRRLRVDALEAAISTAKGDGKALSARLVRDRFLNENEG